MQRYNFQFTGQRFFRIRDGRLAGQLRDVAYQATTTDFWGSMEAVGGPSTCVLGGAFNCGKAQPGQVAAVSHGCPSALFRGVNILNTRAEAVDDGAQEIVERALAGPVGAGRAVLVTQTSRGRAALGQLHADHERPHHGAGRGGGRAGGRRGRTAVGVVSSGAPLRDAAAVDALVVAAAGPPGRPAGRGRRAAPGAGRRRSGMARRGRETSIEVFGGLVEGLAEVLDAPGSATTASPPTTSARV